MTKELTNGTLIHVFILNMIQNVTRLKEFVAHLFIIVYRTKRNIDEPTGLLRVTNVLKHSLEFILADCFHKIFLLFE